MGILKKWRKDRKKEHWSCEVTVDSSYHKLYPILCPIQLHKMSQKCMFTYFSGQLGYGVGSLVLLHWTHHVILHLCDLKSEGTKMKWRHHSTKSWLYLLSAAWCTRFALSSRHLVDTVDTTACRKLMHREIYQYFVLFISFSDCFNTLFLCYAWRWILFSRQCTLCFDIAVTQFTCLIFQVCGATQTQTATLHIRLNGNYPSEHTHTHIYIYPLPSL